MEPVQKNEYYTYSDYAKWDDGARYELIDGIAYMMSPSPNRFHQEIIGNLYLQFAQFLVGKPCKVFLSPFDVRLNAAEEDDTVVQPDLLVICDKSKLTDEGSVGAPDLVIEVLSPSTARNDKSIKFKKYQRYGVREYWIVDPASNTVHAYTLTDGKYVVNVYDDNDVAPVHILDGCFIDLAKVFAL